MAALAQTPNALQVTSDRIDLSSITDGANPRGIPQVAFIEDIETFAKKSNPPASAEFLIGAFSDLFSKFKLYETNLARKRMNYQSKIPEIEKTLGLVKHLKDKKEKSETVVTQYNICDTVYAKAELTNDGTVNLWLGANVMLQYTYDEAIAYLTLKHTDAKKEFEEISEDLQFTRNQVITSEVNMSRIYNWDVKQRRFQKAMETAAAAK